MVEIGTQHEQEWIEMLMSSYILTGAYWLGLSDETQEGIWKWQKSFVEASYTAWCSDPEWCYDDPSPHVDRTKNCAHIAMSFNATQNWYDIECNLDRDHVGFAIHAICETENTARLE